MAACVTLFCQGRPAAFRANPYDRNVLRNTAYFLHSTVLQQIKEDILFDHPDTNPPLSCSQVSGRTAADPLLSVVSALERRRSLKRTLRILHYTIYAHQKTHLQLTTHTASLASFPHLHPSFTHLSLPSFTLSSLSLRYHSLIRSPLDLPGFLFQPNERATFDEGCCSFPFSLCPFELSTAPLYSHTRTHVVSVAPQRHGGSPAASRGPRVKR